MCNACRSSRTCARCLGAITDQPKGDQMIVENYTDAWGNPSGGNVVGMGLNIRWQDGPRAREDGTLEEPNGAFIEDVIQAAKQRLEYFQSSKYVCRENALAITKLEEALHWLEHRRKDRAERGVEGKHEL